MKLLAIAAVVAFSKPSSTSLATTLLFCFQLQTLLGGRRFTAFSLGSPRDE
jgi:hypothetical protein